MVICKLTTRWALVYALKRISWIRQFRTGEGSSSCLISESSPYIRGAPRTRSWRDLSHRRLGCQCGVPSKRYARYAHALTASSAICSVGNPMPVYVNPLSRSRRCSSHLGLTISPKALSDAPFMGKEWKIAARFTGVVEAGSSRVTSLKLFTRSSTGHE